jgi:hypothetical protein
MAQFPYHFLSTTATVFSSWMSVCNSSLSRQVQKQSSQRRTYKESAHVRRTKREFVMRALTAFQPEI